MTIPTARRRVVLLACLGVAAFASPARAAITWTGDVDPSDPTTWTSDTDGYIGEMAEGTIAVDGGSELIARHSYLGYGMGSIGKATVTGVGSLWTNVGLTLGYEGNGTLDVLAGGTVSTRSAYLGEELGSTGVATVSGSGSQWNMTSIFSSLGVGVFGNGTLNVLAGGTVNSTNSYVAIHGLTTGEVTVSGAGSEWHSVSALTVGGYGAATLRVEDGGLVTAGTLYASHADLYGDGTITATDGAILDCSLLFDSVNGIHNAFSFGTGGVLSVTADGGQLGAGYMGSGSLTIVDGVAVNTQNGYLGYHSAASGEATVTGPDSHWYNSVDLNVGRGGVGTLTVSASASVANDRYGYVAAELGSTGKVTVTGAGSQWNNGSTLYIGHEGDGTLNIQAGGTVTNPHGLLGYYSRAVGVANVSGAGSAWRSSGSLFVGRYGVGTLTISHGGLVNVGNELVIDRELNGDSFVNLSTGGMLALTSDDTGDDSLADFLAFVGGTQAIRYWDDALADWAPITDATYGDDYTLKYQTSGDLAGYTLLTVGEVPPYVPGDFNNDGVVDAADYTVARDHLGDPDETAIGYNGDGGGIGESDLALWRANYGSTLEGLASLNGEAVPEPAAAVQLLLAACLGLETGRRRGGQVACRR